MFELHQISSLLPRLLFICLAVFPSVLAETRVYDWEVAYNYVSPDCYKKLAITINGKSPGPTILAVQNDIIEVHLKNSLVTESVTIHWHGIRQVGTPWFDGTEAISQCAIQPGDTFVYKFLVDRPGTYMYHAHYALQMGAGLHGMIKVSTLPGVSDPFNYDLDHQILLTDWYHTSPYEQAAGLFSLPIHWVGDPNSILIQGRGKFDCSQAGIEAGFCDVTNPQCSRYFMTVTPGQLVRLRIGSLATYSSISFEIEGHNMTVVEADGHYVEPFTVKNLYIYSGETYSVLFRANQDPSRNYWMMAKSVGTRECSTPNALAILNYASNPPLDDPPAVPPVGPDWNDTPGRIGQSLAIKARRGHVFPPPKTSNRTIVLLNTENLVEGRFRLALNNVSLNLPHTPYLVALKENLSTFDTTPPPDRYDMEHYDIYRPPENVNATISNAIYSLDFSTTIDVILQNANSMDEGISDTHPWHLHGHDFWVLAHGEGKFNPSTDTDKFNLDNPIMKNTVPLHPYGWTAIRFRANNPGVWPFHCHVEFHHFLGMIVIFQEGIDQVGQLPESIMGCGESKVLHRQSSACSGAVLV